MPPAIPPPLVSYLESSLASLHGQTLITSVLVTPSPWLLLRFVYAAIYGVGDDGEARQVGTGPDEVRLGERPVVFVSLLRPLSLWLEMGKKMGLDFQALLRSKKVVYVDGLADGSSPAGPGDSSLLSTTRLKALTLNELRYSMNVVLKSSFRATTETTTSGAGRSSSTPAVPYATASTSSSSTGTADAKPLILLDGIDFLLACQPSISTVSLQALLSTLQMQSHALVLTCNADVPLLQTAMSGSYDDGTPLERNHAHFLTSMAHRSRWVFQLRGLDTGSAKDVSGVIRVSKGGDRGDDESEISNLGHTKALPDAEWLYQLKGDGSVRVWGRGE
ncbi:hypothetical protein G647_00964 [Cladophialophora carrionii CBS 160.54]|uniref:Elongator complex protein 6 n=1 Tax=Cladophialophora carrionii CBS 160.54 TaxID=1279043 RepID=V9DNP2_9EURO|nr:uncharacterized protein G647_00964 [Cladophialophora carrionii CBS 160.54]ETI28514.1 hypothetical protein G647_00964 [Cladophialophora carrionii CBS 160.54]